MPSGRVAWRPVVVATMAVAGWSVVVATLMVVCAGAWAASPVWRSAVWWSRVMVRVPVVMTRVSSWLMVWGWPVVWGGTVSCQTQRVVLPRLGAV